MSGLTIRSDSLVNKDNTGSTEFIATVGVGTGYSLTLASSGTSHFNCTGVTTSGPVKAVDANIAGVVTSVNFSGNGSALTGVATITAAKSAAYKYILGDPPLHS